MKALGGFSRLLELTTVNSKSAGEIREFLKGLQASWDICFISLGFTDVAPKAFQYWGSEFFTGLFQQAFVTANSDPCYILDSLDSKIVVSFTIFMDNHENEGLGYFFLYFIDLSISAFLMLFSLKCMDYEDIEHGVDSFKDFFFD